MNIDISNEDLERISALAAIGRDESVSGIIRQRTAVVTQALHICGHTASTMDKFNKWRGEEYFDSDEMLDFLANNRQEADRLIRENSGPLMSVKFLHHNSEVFVVDVRTDDKLEAIMRSLHKFNAADLSGHKHFDTIVVHLTSNPS